MAGEILAKTLEGITQGLAQGLAIRKEQQKQDKMIELQEKELELKKLATGQKSESQIMAETLMQAKSYDALGRVADKQQDNIKSMTSEIAKLTLQLGVVQDPDQKQMIANSIGVLTDQVKISNEFLKGVGSQLQRVSGGQDPVLTAQREKEKLEAERNYQMNLPVKIPTIDEARSTLTGDAPAALDTIIDGLNRAYKVRDINGMRRLILNGDAYQGFTDEAKSYIVNYANDLRNKIKTEQQLQNQEESSQEALQNIKSFKTPEESNQELINRYKPFGGIRN